MASRGPSVRHWLLMSTKPVNTRATTASRAGRVQHGVGHKTPFSGRGSRYAAEDPRPNTLQLNTEGLTADKISVIEQLASTGDPLRNSDKLVIPSFSLAGSVLSRNRGLAVCP